jgi:hypothetical protein
MVSALLNSRENNLDPAGYYAISKGIASDFICIFDKTFTERAGIKQRPHLCVYYFHHQSVLDDKYILMSKFIY